MPIPQESISPLRSALNTLRIRVAPEEQAVTEWEEHTAILSGEDYPELIIQKEEPEPRSTAQRPTQSGSWPVHSPAKLDHQERRLTGLVEEGRLRWMDADRLGATLKEILSDGFLELFIRSVDQIRYGLESAALDDRRWALDSVRALVAQADLSLVPYGTLPLLLDCVGRLLVREERMDLRDAALDISAHLLGVEAARGDLDVVHAHLAWLERMAKGKGAEFSASILASRSLVLPCLELLFREGASVMETRVVPFFRFIGEPGARTLLALLGEQQNRHRRNRILELLKFLGPSCLPALKEGLRAGSWDRVYNALNLVGELEAAETFECVVSCLWHRNPRVLHAAVRALWKTGGARAERHLLGLIPQVKGEIRNEILEGLGRIGTSQAIPAMAALASSSDESVRIQAIGVMGRIKHPNSIPTLEALLKRKGRFFRTAEPLSVRMAAAKALLSIGTVASQRILDQALAEEPKGPDQEALREAVSSRTTWG